jgi:hypothetical protein
MILELKYIKREKLLIKNNYFINERKKK